MREETKEKLRQFFHLAYRDSICLHFRVGALTPILFRSWWIL